MTLRILRVLLGAALLTASSASARLLSWKNSGCETPATFYSSAREGAPMCCANQTRPSVGVCPGGTPCPPDGQCPTAGDTCVALDHPFALLPNFAVVYSDDQGSCDFGFMGSCRTDREGAMVPAPYTPALDALAARGKVFTVAYNAAHWCLPSRDAVITGKLPPQRGCIGGACAPPGTRPDGEQAGIGSSQTIAQLISGAGPGYCSYQSGKGISKIGFDASRPSRRTGRTSCSRCNSPSWNGVDATSCQFDPAACPDPADLQNPACLSQPMCGEDDPNEPPGGFVISTGEVNEFLEDMVATGTDGKAYLPKKFMIWIAPALPHTPVAPADVIEHRPHVTDPTDPDICRDFLFGYRCSGSPGNVQILGPRFPFGGPDYAARFGIVPRSKMQGLYGNLYWLDNVVARLRRSLNAVQVETATGPAPIAANTVILFMSDNGSFLPRSKKKFTENGFRSPLIVYDPRHETAPGAEFRIEDDVAAAVDLPATMLSYAGTTIAPGGAGRDLRARLDSPSPQHIRKALCGTNIRSLNGTTERYILPSGGTLGQCSAPTGTLCLTDAHCAAGQLCAPNGECAAPGPRPCVDDDDCRVNPGDTSKCLFQERRWCSGSPLQACTSDAQCKASCKVCSKAQSRTCGSDLDCGTLGPCIAAPADKLACSCAPRRVKLYQSIKPLGLLLTDLLSDPDESSLIDGTASVSAASISPKLSNRLQCCMDKWWLPSGFAAAVCPNGCDARVDCTL